MNDLFAAMTHTKNLSVFMERRLGNCPPKCKDLIGIGGADSYKTLLDTCVTTFCAGMLGSLWVAGGTLAVALLAPVKD